MKRGVGECCSHKYLEGIYYHLKENFENSMNVYKLRSIKRSVAFSDKFTQNKSNDAKQIFEEATISFQCCQCQIEWVVLLVFPVIG